MAYTKEKLPTIPDSETLRRTIPGWGVDLRFEDRPSHPKEKFEPTGAHWDFPERQPEKSPREKSTEHKFLTPVFGTAQPLHGLSGAIRRYAYTFSEGQTAHWLILIFGDRVDILQSRFRTLLQGRPDNVITESGVTAEFKGSTFRTRFGQHRADLKQQLSYLLLWSVPYVVIAGAISFVVKGARRHL
jgi:hypothetical protein